MLKVMQKDVEFSELMCARFCHDLAGSVGAISNSIDFLDSKNDEMRSKAIDLVQFSSNQAISRVTFFRRAYGFTSNAMGASLSDIKSLIIAFLDGTKLDLNFDESWDSATVNGGLGKLILNSVLIISTLVMHKGAMSLSFNGDSGKVSIAVSSGTYNVGDDLLAILKGRGESIEKNTRNIQHFYTYAVAKSIDYDIDIKNVSDGVMLVLSRA